MRIIFPLLLLFIYFVPGQLLSQPSRWLTGIDLREIGDLDQKNWLYIVALDDKINLEWRNLKKIVRDVGVVCNILLSRYVGFCIKRIRFRMDRNAVFQTIEKNIQNLYEKDNWIICHFAHGILLTTTDED
ncbi:MAG: hypothetical protein GY863_02255 [bacterium]|nr:hypothetical protein [bacterium]